MCIRTALTISYWNSEGLHDNIEGCKLQQQGILQNDIEILSETWGNCKHYGDIENYFLLTKNEPQKDPHIYKGRKSGGILVFCKKHLDNKITRYKSKHHIIFGLKSLKES